MSAWVRVQLLTQLYATDGLDYHLMTSRCVMSHRFTRFVMSRFVWFQTSFEITCVCDITFILFMLLNCCPMPHFMTSLVIWCQVLLYELFGSHLTLLVFLLTVYCRWCSQFNRSRNVIFHLLNLLTYFVLICYNNCHYILTLRTREDI